MIKQKDTCFFTLYYFKIMFDSTIYYLPVFNNVILWEYMGVTP